MLLQYLDFLALCHLAKTFDNHRWKRIVHSLDRDSCKDREAGRWRVVPHSSRDQDLPCLANRILKVGITNIDEVVVDRMRLDWEL